MKLRKTVILGCLATSLAALTLSACSPSNTDAVASDMDGEALFVRNCANCHGLYGEGDGPAAATLSITPPDLRQIAKRNNGHFPHETIVQVIDGRTLRDGHDLPGMPMWGSLLAPADMTEEEAEAYVSERVIALARYLESIQL
jgi:mono/diheme cytochrome c family protein